MSNLPARNSGFDPIPRIRVRVASGKLFMMDEPVDTVADPANRTIVVARFRRQRDRLEAVADAAAAIGHQWFEASEFP